MQILAFQSLCSCYKKSFGSFNSNQDWLPTLNEFRLQNLLISRVKVRLVVSVKWQHIYVVKFTLSKITIIHQNCRVGVRPRFSVLFRNSDWPIKNWPINFEYCWHLIEKVWLLILPKNWDVDIISNGLLLRANKLII